MSAEDAQRYVWIGIALLGVYLLWGLSRAGRVIAARKWTSAWRGGFRLVGWLPLWGAAVPLVAIILFSPLHPASDIPPFEPLRATATLIPLIAACHMAFAFSPADEPALEGLLAAPRPLAWTLFERVALMATPYILLALFGNTIVLARFPAESASFFLGWLSPFLFFVAVAIMVTLSSRQAAFGMTLTIVLWFGLAFMGDGMIFRWPYLWPLHIYLQPEQAISPTAFTLHQTWVALAGLGMLTRAAAHLANPEKLLAALKT
jgi:hypothetical protein